MAAVDLSELVIDLETELNAPGEDIYSTVTETQWVNYLRNAFWNAHLDGLMAGWTESDGLITALGSDSTMSRDQQQVIVMYATMSIIKNKIMNDETLSRYVAGPVEYEVQRSAQVYRAVMEDLKDRLDRVLQRLSDSGAARDIYYIDTYAARQYSIAYGLIDWIGADRG